MNTLIYKANILIEALPYIQKLNGKTVVIKYGGNAMIDSEITKTIMEDITLLKYVGVNPVVVHGGGPQISRMLNAMDIKSKFYKGLRVTNKDAVNVVEMVLAGSINKEIVSQLNALGGKAIGICGKDGNLIEVEKAAPVEGVDLGFVGEVSKINSRIIEVLADDEYIPVIAPIGTDKKGQSYNINADIVASEIAIALKAEKLIYLTDIDGIFLDPTNNESLISVISVPEIHKLIKKGIIDGGMIPKVLGCIKGVEEGVNKTHILNGTIPHPILLEIFTDKGIGTMVEKGDHNSEN
ncbi:MAG TPA: acetylglutamate kinase [Eubacteriaceae bacterium]|jgi:acetylglutamate kinase|nr:acetylglutamate kinase [Eubacteriaceae bacterium]